MKKNYLTLILIFFGLVLFSQENNETSLKVRVFRRFKVESIQLLGEKFYLVNSNNKLNISSGFYHVKGGEVFLIKSSYPKDKNYEPAGVKIIYFPEIKKVKKNYVCWNMEPRIGLIYSVYKDDWLDESQEDYLEVFDHNSGVIIHVLKP